MTLHDLLEKTIQHINYLCCFVNYMDGTNALCASYQVLTEILVVSASTLKRAVKYLKKMDGSVFLKAERQMFILLIQKLHGQVMEVKNNTVNSKQMYC